MGSTSALERSLKKIAKDKAKELSKELYAVSKYVIDELYTEAIHMYDSFIDDYYKYKTTSYIRHGETRPGTGQGINLYRGNMIMKNTSGKNRILSLRISAEDMEDSHYQHDSANFVLDNVLSGYRGVPGYWMQEWEGHYYGKYFSYRGTMENAFSIFADQVVYSCFMQEWNKRGNK